MKHAIILARKGGMLLVAGLGWVSASAYAVTDVTAITTAQGTLSDYAAALLVLGITIWGAMKVVRMFGGK